MLRENRQSLWVFVGRGRASAQRGGLKSRQAMQDSGFHVKGLCKSYYHAQDFKVIEDQLDPGPMAKGGSIECPHVQATDFPQCIPIPAHTTSPNTCQKLQETSSFAVSLIILLWPHNSLRSLTRALMPSLRALAS